MPGGCDDSPMNGSCDACNKRVAHLARRFCETSEYSDAAGERLYYKFFAERKASMFHPPDDYHPSLRMNTPWNNLHPSPH